MAHQEFGVELMDRVKTELGDIAQVEQNPKLEGRQMIMVLGPKRKKESDEIVRGRCVSLLRHF